MKRERRAHQCKGKSRQPTILRSWSMTPRRMLRVKDVSLAITGWMVDELRASGVRTSEGRTQPCRNPTVRVTKLTAVTKLVLAVRVAETAFFLV
eukprot:5469854-Pleurochrysis_carterae.AAC.1